MKKGSVAILGHINVDKELYLESFPSPGVSVSTKKIEEHLGGCAATMAMTAGRLGVEANLFSVVGRDFPEEYMNLLKGHGVGVEGVMVLDGPSPFCIVLNSEGVEQGYIMYQGVSEMEEVLARVPSLYSSTYMILTSGVPSFHRAVAEEAERRGVEVIFDPTQEIHYRWDREDFLGLLERSRYLFTNELEYKKAVELGGGAPLSLSDALKMVVVTRGDRGYRVITGEEERDYPALPAPSEVVMPTGAGDVMRGGFAAGLIMGLPPLLAVRLGAAVAAIAITRKGVVGRFPPLNEVLNWLKNVVDGGKGVEEDRLLLKELTSGKGF
ncbi:MAG: hypothetical protein J7L88_05270 [Thermoplasmata archaeon]|nr:hypothetical protein [Thermoplasmata archaeon]